MRGAPQVGFSATIRKIRARTSLLTRFRPPTRRNLEIHVQYKRNPIRCQFTTVRGVTKTRGFLHPNQNVLNATQNSLSRAVNRVRGGKENPTANPGSIVPKIFPGLVPPALAFTPRGMFPKVRWM